MFDIYEALRLRDEGLSNAEIAEKMGFYESVVRYYLGNHDRRKAV